jgi:hypothetical protein
LLERFGMSQCFAQSCSIATFCSPTGAQTVPLPNPTMRVLLHFQNLGSGDFFNQAIDAGEKREIHRLILFSFSQLSSFSFSALP